MHLGLALKRNSKETAEEGLTLADVIVVSDCQSLVSLRFN